MPTKKIGEIPNIDGWKGFKKPKPLCTNPEHNPPKYRVFKPGIYEHTCPGCKEKQIFVVGNQRSNLMDL